MKLLQSQRPTAVIQRVNNVGVDDAVPGSIPGRSHVGNELF